MRRYSTLAASAALFAALGWAGAAATQTPIQVGESQVGAIEAGDASAGPDAGGAAVMHDDWTLELARGQRVEIIAASEVFDAYLELRAPGAEGEPLASNDDHGDTTDSRIRFTAPEDGAYGLRVRPLSAAEGAYTLSVSERSPAPPPPRPRDIRVGAEVNGDLSERDAMDDEDRLYDAWRLRLDAGDRVTVALAAESFDTVLLVGRGLGEEFEPLASNDDGPDGTDSALVFTAPEGGDYIVRATSFAAGLGEYRLSVEEGAAAVPAASIAVGETREGELTPEDAQDSQGVRHDVWRLTLAEGQRVAVALRADAFDAYLAMGREGPGGLTDVVEDDDGAGEGTNSRLSLTADRAGDWLIHARGLAADALGAYSLSVEEIPPDPEPVELTPASGVVQGEIGEGDAVGDGGRRFDAWRVTGVEGRRMRAIMRSGDFDTYLELGEAGEAFTPLMSDDDGLGEGTDSRLDYTFPADGDYILRASPLAADEDGLYSLELLDRGPPPAAGSILVGAAVRGTLDEDSATNDMGAAYDDYAIRLEAGQKVRLTLVSNAFDALLAVAKAEDADGASIQPIASDDDGLSDTHSLIEITIEEAGDYVIRAGALAAGQTGDYVLTVEPQE